MDNNIKNFIYDNFDPYSNSQLTAKFFFSWLFNIAFYFIGSNAIFWGIAVTVLNIIVYVIYLTKKKELVYTDLKILSIGISDIYLGLLFTLLSYRIFTKEYTDNILILLILILIVCMFVCLSWIITYILIKKGKCNSHKSKKTSSILGCIIGLGLARATIPYLQDHSILIATVLFFAISVFFAVKGGKNILRYLLLNNSDASTVS